MLAGLAPLHAERLAARGGPVEAVHDPLTFFDTSSYGPRAIDAMLRVVGVDRLLYGSDVPVVEPVSLAPLGEAVDPCPDRCQPGANPVSELDGSALESLVRDLAADPAVWEHLVQHTPDARHYEELRRDDDVAVWLICWMDDHDTGFHDHDLSGGAVAVVEGAVAEDRLALGGPPVDAGGRGRARRFTSPRPTSTASATSASVPAVTIHAYSPPLWRMGAYEVLEGGELRRHSLSYAEELRPLD